MIKLITSGLAVIAGAAVTGALFAASPDAAAPSRYRVIADLTPQTQAPIGIIEGSPGVFYVQASGVEIYSVTKAGNVSVSAFFADPPYIVESAPGTVGANGRLYSSIETTGNNGTGTVFSVTPAVGSQILYTPSSYAPTFSGNLPSGDLFGFAYDFATASTVLATGNLAGSVTPFYQFPTNTQRPYPPILGSDGNFYGTAQIQEGSAYFYKVTPSGAFTKIATLPYVIISAVGNGLVLQGSDGNFYGIQSGESGCGTQNVHGGVYKLTPGGQYTVLHDFGVCGNAIVNSLIEGSDGNLYGMTEYNNLLFRLSKSGEFKALYQAANGSQGICSCTLVQGSDGLIYGTALGGGASGGYGAIFSFDAGLPIPQPNAAEFSPSSGAVGARVRIWGYNLLRSSVEFNGIPATGVQSAGPNYVWATVPTGATTGPITVTTPGGSSTTQDSFTVQ